jgi:hypothetical protein
MTDFPHVPAAFINAIAEEGTKAEAIEWLQKQWNESCALRSRLKYTTEALEQADKVIFDQNGAGCVGVNASVDDLSRWAEEANERYLGRLRR